MPGFEAAAASNGDRLGVPLFGSMSSLIRAREMAVILMLSASVVASSGHVRYTCHGHSSHVYKQVPTRCVSLLCELLRFKLAASILLRSSRPRLSRTFRRDGSMPCRLLRARGPPESDTSCR